MQRKLFFLITIIFLACNSSEQKKREQADNSFTNSTACIFSQIAYCITPQDTLTKYLPSWKIVWEPSSIRGNHAFVATDGKKYVIAIRGSLLQFSEDAFENWVKQDLHVATQEKWPYTDSASTARISQGAYDGWQNLCNLKCNKSGKSLKQFLDSATNQSTPLLITGHSLGGNLATVYSSWLQYEMKKAGSPYNYFSVITFAAPAPGNAVFANDFNNKFPNAIRVENTNDIVPKFPIANEISKLDDLYKPTPSAKEIEVDIAIISFKLTTIFDGIRLAIKAIEMANNNSVYTHTKGTSITIPCSGKNTNNTVEDFFAEAGYQHSVNQYAASVGAPVIKTP
jgi:triacylglycerol lipase